MCTSQPSHTMQADNPSKQYHSLLYWSTCGAHAQLPVSVCCRHPRQHTETGNWECAHPQGDWSTVIGCLTLLIGIFAARVHPIGTSGCQLHYSPPHQRSPHQSQGSPGTCSWTCQSPWGHLRPCHPWGCHRHPLQYEIGRDTQHCWVCVMECGTNMCTGAVTKFNSLLASKHCIHLQCASGFPYCVSL